MTETGGTKSLYTRLGGYDAVAAVCEELLKRMMADTQLARFWRDRALDSVRREKQLLIDFLCSNAGGPVYYMGRDMPTSHRGMGINEADWAAFQRHLHATLDAFQVPNSERQDVLAFIAGTKKDIVEV